MEVPFCWLEHSDWNVSLAKKQLIYHVTHVKTKVTLYTVRSTEQTYPVSNEP